MDLSWILHCWKRFPCESLPNKKSEATSDSEKCISKKKVISLICFDFTCSCFFLVVLVGLGRWNQQTALQVNIAGHHEQKINNHQSN